MFHLPVQWSVHHCNVSVALLSSTAMQHALSCCNALSSSKSMQHNSVSHCNTLVSHCNTTRLSPIAMQQCIPPVNIAMFCLPLQWSVTHPHWPPLLPSHPLHINTNTLAEQVSFILFYYTCSLNGHLAAPSQQLHQQPLTPQCSAMLTPPLPASIITPTSMGHPHLHQPPHPSTTILLTTCVVYRYINLILTLMIIPWGYTHTSAVFAWVLAWTCVNLPVPSAESTLCACELSLDWQAQPIGSVINLQ